MSRRGRREKQVECCRRCRTRCVRTAEGSDRRGRTVRSKLVGRSDVLVVVGVDVVVCCCGRRGQELQTAAKHQQRPVSLIMGSGGASNAEQLRKVAFCCAALRCTALLLSGLWSAEWTRPIILIWTGQYLGPSATPAGTTWPGLQEKLLRSTRLIHQLLGSLPVLNPWIPGPSRASPVPTE